MDTEQSWRDYLFDALRTAARFLGVWIVGVPVYGLRERSIGCGGQRAEEDVWLRVTAELASWAHGDLWEGNAAAAGIKGVTKPEWLGSHEWSDGDRRLRAELMTLAPSPVSSPTLALRTPIQLSASWWESLRGSVDALAAWPTARVSVDQPLVARRLLAFFGQRIDPTVREWTTAHGDLHWANLTAPECWLLDWESWGRAPAGYDAALLYCSSLLQPAVARGVHAVFADILDTPDGLRAQACAIAKLLLMVNHGDEADLAEPLHQHARQLLTSQWALNP